MESSLHPSVVTDNTPGYVAGLADVGRADRASACLRCAAIHIMASTSTPPRMKRPASGPSLTGAETDVKPKQRHR
ncbi:hypothetical protein NQZ68_002175 [Dissostichus eleginoides]|nr:hypothetical protein NQZ68_002175 [Dissostichus eleginoides]